MNRLTRTVNKRTLLIGAAVVAGVVLLFFIGQMFFIKPVIPGTEATKVEVDQTRPLATLALHQLCVQADSVGIDTTQFAVLASDSIPQLTTKQQRLAMEVRYGKKTVQDEF